MKCSVTEDINNSLAYSDPILHKTEEKIDATEYRKHNEHDNQQSNYPMKHKLKA
jgi:hypothetical protein